LPIVLLWLSARALLAADGPATTTTPRWVATATLDAREAHQAAAADREHVYAISSTQIARYDRRTGERLAVSTGDAQHLNSGFMHEGRLLAAHSNYPRVPELSEIKVLDLDSMRLETFKNFGDFGGSLTWAVVHKGDWWCNFARYGASNAETFLVQFDEEWRERRRWTYPREVLDHIGLASISGGLWRGDSLLVTDHDHRVLYELRVPDQGTVLQFVAQHNSPFPGQGIAADPVTGGLVGIDRSRKQVIFASPVLRVKGLTYNIHHGEGVDGKLDLQRIALAAGSIVLSRWKIASQRIRQLAILPFDVLAADKFNSRRAQQVRVSTMDLKIASIALVHDATLLTSNVRNFERVPGLRVEDWL
jgi:hypothetical protein